MTWSSLRRPLRGPVARWPRGQFVGYYRSTLLLGEFERGLCLEGAVPEWGVSPAGMGGD